MHWFYIATFAAWISIPVCIWIGNRIQQEWMLNVLALLVGSALVFTAFSGIYLLATKVL